MTDLAQKQAPQRRGFSLVLSLTIMAMILLMVITLASFLSIEARLASANQLRTQARMQALVSLRLALAHLQQEAGPDRRATFRADMYRFAYANASTRPSTPVSWKNTRNPMWTGVQRTDRPFQLPSWIISGRGDNSAGTQMISLAKPPMVSPPRHLFEFTPISYPSNYWIPWETGYTGGTDSIKIILVGDATATDAEDEGDDPLSGRPDGHVSLPPVALPDTNVSGRYCYWVGDEGVKANISLIDPRVQTSSATYNLTAARRGVGRTGAELLTGLSNYQVGDIDSRVRSTDQLKLLSSSVFSDSTGNNAKALWPDVTLVSRGLLTDNRFGGLQIDLSTVFEKEDDYFDDSEFGMGDGSAEGSDGAITYAFEEGKKNSRGTPDWQGYKNWKKPILFNDLTYNVAPVWTLMNRPGVDGDGQATARDFNTTTAAQRGPTWYAIRDYHRLYQRLTSGASGTQLSARTHFPNVIDLSASSYPSAIGYLHYSQMYNRSITPRAVFDGTSITYPTGSDSNNFFDFKGYDKIYCYGPRGNSYNTLIANNNLVGNFSGPLPTKVSVAPTITRQLVAIGMIKVPKDLTTNELYLTISPITVLHNPYNVKLAVGAQRISIRDMDNWWVEFTRNYKPGLENSIDTFNGLIPAMPGSTPQTQRKWKNDEGILSVIKRSDPAGNEFQSLRFDIPATTMEPGEFKIFTASSLTTNYSSTLSNGYNTNTGFYGPCLTEYKTALPPITPVPLTTTRSDTASLFIQLWTSSYMPEGFKVVHQMVSWHDSLPSWNATSEAIYNTCSIVSELTVSPGRNASYGLSSSINGPEPATRQIVDATMPVPGEQPILLGVLDYDTRWASDPSPFQIYARSNPLAASRRVDANDATWYHVDGLGNADTLPPGPYFSGTEYHSSTSPSYKFIVRDVLSFAGLVDVSGSNAYGGMSSTSINNGVTQAVFTEVPLSAPLSLAQYTHANFGIFDHEPLYVIGNSLAPAFAKNSNLMQYREGLSSASTISPSPVLLPPRTAGEASAYDVSMIINRALFDRFFLSGISPEYSNGLMTKSQASVIDDFIDGKSSLSNPRIKLVTNDKETARTELKNQKINHRKVAKYIVNDGAFNIHSMSVRAWAAILAGAKAKALNNETGDSSINARFPRAVRNDTVNTSGVNQASYSTAAAWTGLTNLTDNQINLLAREIVKENIWRMSFYHRDAKIAIIGSPLGHAQHGTGIATGVVGLTMTVRDLPSNRLGYPAGKLPAPYFGLSQFVNRSLCPHSGAGFRLRSGALQNAIVAADAIGAKLANRSNNGIPDKFIPTTGYSYSNSPFGPNPSPTGLRRGMSNPLLQPPEVEGSSQQIELRLGTIPFSSQNYADVKLGAPTSLLQSDILAAIGNSLTVRSDTFTIRAYGDVSDKAGGQATGSCWIEAVVQRLPEFIDNSQNADTAVSSPSNGLGHNPNLLPVNVNLGRRFVIISMRLLKPNEL